MGLVVLSNNAQGRKWQEKRRGINGRVDSSRVFSMIAVAILCYLFPRGREKMPAVRHWPTLLPEGHGFCRGGDMYLGTLLLSLCRTVGSI